MKNAPPFCTLLLLGLTLPAYSQFVQLKNILDNDYLVVSGDTLYFTYQEPYAIAVEQNDSVECRIYDEKGDLAGSTIHLPNRYGRNDQRLPLPVPDLNTCHYYLLEVSGYDKEETGYLRFRLSDPTLLEATIETRAWLSGPYDRTTGLMQDQLREKGLIPLTSPFAELGYKMVYPCTPDAPVDPSLLVKSGKNAIVDWILLELRPECDPASITATRSALIQRDGDVVDVDGTSPVSICVPAGRYLLAIRHRMHLGAMTLASFGLFHNGDAVQVDFTNPATQTWGTHATSTVNQLFPQSSNMDLILWPGDANGDKYIVFYGPNGNETFYDPGNNSDLHTLSVAVLKDPENVLGYYNFISSYLGYTTEDLNMDGQVIFEGNLSDREYVTFPVFVFPENMGGNPFWVIAEQVPR